MNDANESPTCVKIASAPQALGIAAVASTVFSTDRQPLDGLRLCLGGVLTRDDCGRAPQAVEEALRNAGTIGHAIT